MGIPARKNGERLRTIWTSEMDRYFIDLMLEQVDKGNRVDDCLFSKRAWKHMTSFFNTKFKFQYSKDVLKNRHKTLRNLYKAVRNLLEQKGFNWDETRQMVTADNDVWDEYIKVHPDARSYRIKTIPYYSDLCFIYRSTTLEGKSNDPVSGANSDNNMLGSETSTLLEGLESVGPYDNGELSDYVSEASPFGENSTLEATQPSSASVEAVDALHEIMIDEDYGISISKGNGDDNTQAMPDVMGSTISNRSRTYWQPPMDRYFIDLMLEQVRKGNQIDGVFRKQAWMEMIALFNANFGFKYDIDVLKNRYKTLKRQYNVISNLLELNGFVWDDARLMVTADDHVWQDYIKTHTDARQFMTRPVPYYKDLCVICKDPSIDDIDCFSGQYLETTVSESEDQLGDFLELAHLGSKNGGSKNGVYGQRKRPRLENPSNSAHLEYAHSKDGNMVNGALHEMDDAGPPLSDKKKDDDDSNSLLIENVIEAVQALPDMDEDLVLDACDFLEDEKKAKTFLALDVKLRKKWLMRKLRPQQS